MYRIACKLVKEGWGDPAEVADGLGVVLLTWNQAAYRYGSFDFDELERFVKSNQALLDTFRRRRIKSFNPETETDTVRSLFDEALDALANTKKKKKTPVGAAKALHVLAPDFFPLWDLKIAKGCHCSWYGAGRAAAKYIAFMEYAQATVASLEVQFADGRRPVSLPPARSLAASLSKNAGCRKTMLKFLDEYLYATYTKKDWS
jgi:hypothetical protein